MAFGAYIIGYIGGQGDILGHVGGMALYTSLVVNVFGMGSAVAIGALWNIAVIFVVTCIAR